MKNLKDHIWLWGQTPGSHHHSGNTYRLPGVNRMTPEEGLDFFGISNVCRVKMQTDAGKSFLDGMGLPANAKKLCLSLVGAGDLADNDLEDIIQIAKEDERIRSAVMDDFISDLRMKLFPPEELKKLKARLHTGAGRELELWSVIYERDLDRPIESLAREFDLTTFWTWYGDNLARQAENYARIRGITGGGRMMMGVYMYDYGGRKPLSDEVMIRQLEFVKEKFEAGEIEGMILCSNCIADLGLHAVDITRDWIAAL